MKSKILCIFWTIFTIALIACSGSNTAPSPTVTEEEKSLAISSIEQQQNVIDADFTQEGNILSLALIIEYGVSKGKAKALGKNFVRLVKNFSKDTNPEREIGSGIYDYIIGVYYPNKKEVVLGAKSSISRFITW